MKKNLIISLTMIVVLIIGILTPLVSSGDQHFLTVFFLFNWRYTGFSLILWIPFAMAVSVSILQFFPKYKGYTYFLSLITFVYFIFNYWIAKYFLGEDGSLYLNVGGYLLIVAMAINVIRLHLSVMDEYSFSVKDIVEIAVFTGLAIALDLDFFKISVGANGGSISFVMVPLIIISIRKGFYKGFIASGIIFGIITCLLDGWGLQFFPFDYFLGFGSLAIVGLFNPLTFNKEHKFTWLGLVFILTSTLLAVTLRTLSSTISGMIFYEMSFGASLSYNLTYMLPASLVTIALICLLYQPLIKVNKIYPSQSK